MSPRVLLKTSTITYMMTYNNKYDEYSRINYYIGQIKSL